MPELHKLHCDDDEAAATVDHVPELHRLQVIVLDAPIEDDQEPALQVTQNVADEADHVPALHIEH